MIIIERDGQYCELDKTVEEFTASSLPGKGWTQYLGAWPIPVVLTEEDTLASLTQALDEYINSRFAVKGYDSRITVAMRTGYAGPWHDECVIMSLWMDTCYVKAYEVMADVKVGKRAIPTKDELLAEMPVLMI